MNYCVFENECILILDSLLKYGIQGENHYFLEHYYSSLTSDACCYCSGVYCQ